MEAKSSRIVTKNREKIKATAMCTITIIIGPHRTMLVDSGDEP